MGPFKGLLRGTIPSGPILATMATILVCSIVYRQKMMTFSNENVRVVWKALNQIQIEQKEQHKSADPE